MNKLKYTLKINLEKAIFKFFLPALGVGILITFICFIFDKIKKKQKSLKSYLGIFELSTYIATIYNAIVFSRLKDTPNYPFVDIYGGWKCEERLWFYDFTVLWNVIAFLFIGLSLFLFFRWTRSQKLKNKNLIIVSTSISFLISCSLETLQIITRRGTFQFSDIFYNTLGGFLGVVLLVMFLEIIKKIKNRNNK